MSRLMLVHQTVMGQEDILNFVNEAILFCILYCRCNVLGIEIEATFIVHMNILAVAVLNQDCNPYRGKAKTHNWKLA